jgi:hypothetical protein
LYPPRRSEQTTRRQPGGVRAFLQQNFSASLKLLMINAIGKMFTPAQSKSEVEHHDPL